MKVAIVHDWFISPGGAEKVVNKILSCYPDADLFSIIDTFSEAQRKEVLFGKKVHTTFLNYFPFVKHYYRFLLLFFPLAIKQLNVRKYDLVISSSHSFAKGVRTRSDQMHICYIHTPFRYAWNLSKQYLKQIPNPTLKKLFISLTSRLRRWDLKSNKHIDYFIANSNFIADQVRENYKREAAVIYPPVDVARFSQLYLNGQVEKKDYFVVVSRMILYKRVDLIVKAFNKLPELNLLVVGEGPKSEYLKSISNSNIKFTGYCSEDELVNYISSARAAVFAAYEDFGITPVEIQSAGVPVIALGKGGYLETVVDSKTGVLFKNQTLNSVISGIDRFIDLEDTFVKEEIYQNAQRFSSDIFISKFKRFVQEKIKS